MNVEQPRISVIIPAYNTQTLLERCVRSVCAQTYPQSQMEIIIVDDGSTDGTGILGDRLAAEYANVICYHEANAGSSAARNMDFLMQRVSMSDL